MARLVVERIKYIITHITLATHYVRDPYLNLRCGCQNHL